MSDKITKASMLRVLPSVIEKSETVQPIAEATAEQLVDLTGDVDVIRIFSMIDALPESLLDILATDLNVFWYDYDDDLDVKRKTIQGAWYVHRHLGTIGAVRKALSALWPDSQVQEWWEYSGDPYHFRVIITGVYSPDMNARTMKSIIQNKNVRSILDEIVYQGAESDSTIKAGAQIYGMDVTEVCEML